MLASCKKSSSSTTTTPTSDDAADIATSSIQIGSGGFADQAGSVTIMSASNGYGLSNPEDGHGKTHKGGIDGGPLTGPQGRLTCGVPFDTTVTYSYSGPNVTASFTHQWELTLNCVDTSLAFAGTFTGNYDGPAITGSRTGTRDWVLTGIGTAYTAFVINGTFNCNGSWTMKVRSMNTFTNTVAITCTDVTVDKITHRITGGTGTVNITCVVSNGHSYQFTGTVVFNGDHTATLTINGKTYTILI
jgi:hypothetical protein